MQVEFTKRLGIGTFLCVLLLVSGCAAEPRLAIVGRWNWVNTIDAGAEGAVQLEFFEDGTLSTTLRTARNPDYARTPFLGNYSFVDKDRIKQKGFLAMYFGPGNTSTTQPTTIPAFLSPMLVKVEIAGDRLTLTTPDNTRLTYQKSN